MRNFFFNALAYGLVLSTASPVPSPVPLIIDTDIGGGACMDVDDVLAICIANALADKGEADLLAVVQNTSPDQCAGVISVLNTWYGRENTTLIGSYKGDSLHGSTLPYVPALVQSFPSPVKSSHQVPDAVAVYRKTLAAAADRSVVISSIGLLTNLAGLLQSKADSFSTLSGPDLIKKKVAALYVMGGNFPKSTIGPECNVCGCYNNADDESKEAASRASSFVAANWPTELVWSGFEVGVAVQSGNRLSSCAPQSNPCRAALENFEGGPNKGRFSWDPLTTLAAVRGIQGAHCSRCSNCSGQNIINASTGFNAWMDGPASLQTYIVLDNASAASDALNDLLCAPPKGF